VCVCVCVYVCVRSCVYVCVSHMYLVMVGQCVVTPFVGNKRKLYVNSKCPMHCHRRRFVSKLGGGLVPLPLFFPLLFFPPFLLFSLSPFPPLSCYTLFVPPFHLPFLFPLNQSMGERCDLLTFVFSVLYKCSYLLTYLSSPSGVRGGALAGRRRILCILTAGKSWLNADGGKCMKTYDKKFTNFFTLAKLS